MKQYNKLMSISALSLITICKLSATEPPPNVIYILADDMGYGDIGAYNKYSRIPTPTLDSMASRGITFTDAHSNSSVSTPTRYGTLTGRYAFRTRLKTGVLTGYSSPLIEKNRETVASFLNKNGYQTACIGKWHLGLDWMKKDSEKPLYTGNEWALEDTKNVDYEAHINGGPSDCGFDYSCILPASLDMPPYVYIENGRITEPVNKYTKGFSDKQHHGVFYRHGDVANNFKHEECLNYFICKAEEYIKRAAEGGKPYFLYLPLTAPHSPWLPTQQFRGRSQAGVYGDFICMLDEMIKRIHDAVNESKGAENTLIIFTSDNGAMWLEEDILKTGHHANGEWRGKKSDLWEGGHRTPFIVTWPKKIKQGKISEQLISSTDLLATMAEMVGKKLPEGAGEDSYSYWNEIVGENKNNKENKKRNTMIYHSINGNFALRKGDWVLLDCKGSGGWSLPDDKATDLPNMQLYNLKNDKNQQNNLFFMFPTKVVEMKKELEQIKQNNKY